MKGLDFFALLMGILIVFGIIYFSQKGLRFKIPKRKRNSSKKAKKKFWSEGLKETIRWTIFSLICLILLLVTVKYVFSLFDSGDTKPVATETSIVVVTQKQVLGTITINFGGKYGDRVYLYQNFPSNTEFKFIDATADYAVINRFGAKAYALAGQDASDQLGFSDGNIWLRFRSQDDRSGSLKILMYTE